MASEKIDPIGNEYFRPLYIADQANSWLFFLSALLSILALFVSKERHPSLHDLVHLLFALSVIVLFLSSLSIRLYFFPRAQFRRYQDFLSHAFSKPLGAAQSTAYYNNSATTPPTRIAAQVLESSYFSKCTLARMAVSERCKLVFYLTVWSVAVLFRNTDLALVGVAAQIVFSEQILSRWFRLEWLRKESESIYDELLRLFQSKAKLDTASLEMLGRYEIAKATAAISVSTKTFEKFRLQMNAEWEDLRKKLNL